MASSTATHARMDAVLPRQNEPLAAIAAVTYRSRAVDPMSELELHRLARDAQLRNGIEGVTGLMVYDSGWIFQRLEGPADSLARIWASIRSDRRHASIDVLSSGPADKRHFQDWALKLSVRGAEAGAGQRGMADEPPELIGRLCRGERPEDLYGLPSASIIEKRVSLALAGQALLASKAALVELIATAIVPRLLAARSGARCQPPSLSASLSVTLATLLVAADATSAFAFVEAALHRYLSLGRLSADLLEPAARELGDLWQSDDCSEIEVTIGLMRLQAIARDFGLGTQPLRALHPPVVLVAPQPGEAHMLGAALDAEMLSQAGWSPHVDFPSSSGALDALVAGTWIDALDLSLSTCFRRDHRLGQLGKTIASARLASRNPGMVVVVSGRVFSDLVEASDSETAGRSIGADGIFSSASQAQSAILQALRRPLSGDGIRSVQ